MPQPAVVMPTPVVSLSWLEGHLHQPGVVVIDCRFSLGDPQQGRSAYQRGHLPGAYYLDLNQDLSHPGQSHGGRHPLPDWPSFIAKLEALGIASEPETAVVAYDATKGAFAARLWWMLQYLGHRNVAVLDGGFPAWEAARLPVETQLPQPPATGQFFPHIQPGWIVDRADVLKLKDTAETVLVDARSPERFRGELEPIDPIAGSIPGAMNVFWQSNLTGPGYFKTDAELQQQWDAIAPEKAPIFYCGSGVTACVNALAQVKLGRPMPKIYVGGWSDWCSYESAEVNS